jgi:hypothetical protein
MIEDAGGWEWDTLSEDCDLSYRAQLRGWKFVYVPAVDCPSELPVDMFDFQVQQGRWAKGLTQVAQKMLPRIFRAPIPWRTKLEAFFHLTPNLSYPLMVLVSALLLPVMIVRFYMGWFQMVFLDLPLIVATFLSLGLFYVLAQQELYPKGWKRALFLLPALLAAGVGLTIVNTRGVLEAFFGVPSSFTRTPKFALGKASAHAARLNYRRRSGWLPFLEIAIGTYFLAMVAYAIDSFNFCALPFLLLFVVGYYWAGFGTLRHELRDRLEALRARQRLELETAR